MTRAVKKTITLPPKVTSLLKKGVRMTNPFSVEIGDEVNPERIAGSVTIYGAARICGPDTLIADDVKLGYEAPVTLINCRLDRAVELKGGYFADSVFLEKAMMGSNAQVRSGCLLEEESGANHTVGLKQTILFPFVTLGSLINFCDCLMAGGTNRKNHSEVGSSYIHFNYTPQQDKATASLIGDVPRGVMLKENPIFLGGQGGIVGPLQIDFGKVIPAGIICRRDARSARQLSSSPATPALQKKFLPVVYGDINQKVYLNVLYIANLLALRQWYIHVRHNFFLQREFGAGLYAGACQILNEAIAERIKQMSLFARNLAASLLSAAGQKKKKLPDNVVSDQRELLCEWPEMEIYLNSAGEEKLGRKNKAAFLKIIKTKSALRNSYLEMIKSLKPAEAAIGSDWLGEIVTGIMTKCLKNMNLMQQEKK